MGRLMGETSIDKDADILIPVPLHRSGRREYNQSLRWLKVFLRYGIYLLTIKNFSGRMISFLRRKDELIKAYDAGRRYGIRKP